MNDKEFLNPLIEETVGRIVISKLPLNCDPLTLAASDAGLNVPLTGLQKIVLALISAGKGYDMSPFFRTPDVIRQLSGLLGKDGENRQIWLPPGSELVIADDILTFKYIPPINVILCIAGRRSGKTTIASILFSWLARQFLLNPEFTFNLPILPSSTVSLLNVACDSNQARILFRMLLNNLHQLGVLPETESSSGQVAIGPDNRLLIESLSSSSRSARGRTAMGVCFDEFAHFQRTGGPLADRAMWLALTPSLATFGSKALAIVATTPAGRSGVVWDLFQERGIRENMLTIQVPTWEMNPYVSREKLESEFTHDEFLARQEYGAEFLTPQGRFLQDDNIRACVSALQPEPTPFARWHIHVDLGLVHDATAIALGFILPEHSNDMNRRVVIARLDVFEGTHEHPVNVKDIEARIISLISGIPGSDAINRTRVTFDQYQSAFLVERLKSKGIDASIVPATPRINQESYALLRDLIASRLINLPDHPRLLSELANLECSPTPQGFKVNAASGHMDDCADSVAMCAWMLSQDTPSVEWHDMLQIIERT